MPCSYCHIAGHTISSCDHPATSILKNRAKSEAHNAFIEGEEVFFENWLKGRSIPELKILKYSVRNISQHVSSHHRFPHTKRPLIAYSMYYYYYIIEHMNTSIIYEFSIRRYYWRLIMQNYSDEYAAIVAGRLYEPNEDTIDLNYHPISNQDITESSTPTGWVWPDVAVCPICMDNCKDSDVVITNCRHYYCSDCIHNMIRQNNHPNTPCAICRTPINSIERKMNMLNIVTL